MKRKAAYKTPKIHHTLTNPQTDIELAVSGIHKKLKARPSFIKPDPDNPRNMLVIADPDDIKELQTKWDLPEVYLTFLSNYSPLFVNVPSEEFIEGIILYGADRLIEMQAGYSYNAITNEPDSEWPQGFIVIGDASANPFCINLNDDVDGSVPIYYAEHGAESWDFEVYEDSFVGFLKRCAK